MEEERITGSLDLLLITLMLLLKRQTKRSVSKITGFILRDAAFRAPAVFTLRKLEEKTLNCIKSSSLTLLPLF